MPRATTFKCSVCGQEHPIEDMTRTQDRKKVCPSCRNSLYTQCADCGAWVKKDSRHMAFVFDRATGQERLVCKRCLTANYFLCAVCGRYHLNTEGHREVRIGTFDATVCEGCFGDRFTTCPTCGALVPRSEVRTFNGTAYCQRCFDERFFVCRDCEEVHPRNEDDGNNRCPNCHASREDRMRRERNKPHGYHWGRSENWYKDPLYCDGEDRAAELSLGVELEMDYGQFDFAVMGDGDRLYHFERDGSLGSNGAECITQPCSLLYHQKKFPWRALLAAARSCGFKSHDTTTCGLHVHIGRSSVLDQETEAKLDLFINRNIDMWEKVARRSSEQWAKAKKDKTWREAQDSCRYRDHDSRYQAVNHTNGSTVEIRIARGTLKYETLLGTIELYDACVHFVNDLTVDEATLLNGESWNDFVRYVCDRKERYPNAVWVLANHADEGVAKLTRIASDDHAGDPVMAALAEPEPEPAQELEPTTATLLRPETATLMINRSRSEIDLPF